MQGTKNMATVGSFSPFTDAIMGFSDLSEEDLHLSTYATVLVVLVILKELPELSKLIKESPNDRLIDLIMKILGFASSYLKTFWETKDNDERLQKQKEKINALLESLDLFAEVPAEVSSASEELDSQIGKSERITQALAEKMQAANGLLARYSTDLAALRAQHLGDLIAKIEQKNPLNTTAKDALKNPKQTERETSLEVLQALASQLEKKITKESLHELSDKQLVELIKKTLSRDTLTSIELKVIHALITNFAAINMRTPKINELRTALKELDSLFTQEQKEEKTLRKSFEEKVAAANSDIKKIAQETSSLKGLGEDRLAALTKQIVTPEAAAEELVN